MRVCPACGNTISRQIVVDLNKNTIRYNGRSLVLRPSEAEIAFILARHFPNTVRHERLRSAYYGAKEGARDEARTIQTHICALRRRLEPLGLTVTLAQKVGYFLEAHDGAVAHLPRSRCTWTEERQRELIELCRQGIGRDEIGKAMKLSVSKVKSLHAFLVRKGDLVQGSLPPLVNDLRRKYPNFRRPSGVSQIRETTP